MPTRFMSTPSSPTRLPANVLAKLSGRPNAGEAEEDAVPRLEERLAELLGKPAAAMFPSGTMAQQVAMRVHADRRGIRMVTFQPQCHLEVHGNKAYAVVHGLVAALVGVPFSLIQLSDLAELSERER